MFISAFTGDDGAIYAYQLEPKSGQWKLLQRTPGVENPFFLAVSPDNKFLYAIHAPGQFGGEAHEQIGAYEIFGRWHRRAETAEPSVDPRFLVVLLGCRCNRQDRGRRELLDRQRGISSGAQDGSLGEISSFVQHTGSSVNPARQKAPILIVPS